MTYKEFDYMFLPIKADKDLVREIEKIQSYLTEKVAESEIKAQAVKEFAERLTDKIYGYDGWHNLQKEINELLKEYEK